MGTDTIHLLQLPIHTFLLAHVLHPLLPHYDPVHRLDTHTLPPHLRAVRLLFIVNRYLFQAGIGDTRVRQRVNHLYRFPRCSLSDHLWRIIHHRLYLINTRLRRSINRCPCRSRTTQLNRNNTLFNPSSISIILSIISTPSSRGPLAKTICIIGIGKSQRKRKSSGA
jgi:hypothetical protein